MVMNLLPAGLTVPCGTQLGTVKVDITVSMIQEGNPAPETHILLISSLFYTFILTTTF